MQPEAQRTAGSHDDDDFVEHVPMAAEKIRGEGVELREIRGEVSAPVAVEPTSSTADGFGFAYDDEPEGFAASGMVWDSESGFPYRAEQDEDSVLARVVRIVSSVASSGVAARYAPLSGTLGAQGGVAREGELEEKWKTLEELIPGLTHGALLLGQIEQAGHGTVAKVSAPLPNCENATYSTTVDENGRVQSCWVDSEMPLEAPDRIEVEVPGAGGGEAGSPHSTAKLVFIRDAGAQKIALDLKNGLSAKTPAQDEDTDMWLAPGRPWNVKKDNHVASSFIFEPALPLGSIVTKVQRGRVLVLGYVACSVYAEVEPIKCMCAWVSCEWVVKTAG